MRSRNIYDRNKVTSTVNKIQMSLFFSLLLVVFFLIKVGSPQGS